MLRYQYATVLIPSLGRCNMGNCNLILPGALLSTLRVVLLSTLVGSWMTATAVPVDVTKQKLRILFRPDNIKLVTALKGQRAVKKQIKKMCDVLGRPMLVGRGPWGMGAFSSYSCKVVRRVVHHKKKLIDWVLVVHPRKKNIMIEFGRLKKSLNSSKGFVFKKYNKISIPISSKLSLTLN